MRDLGALFGVGLALALCVLVAVGVCGAFGAATWGLSKLVHPLSFKTSFLLGTAEVLAVTFYRLKKVC